MRGNTRRLGSDICQNIALGKITRQCLCQCWASLCLSLLQFLPGTNPPRAAQRELQHEQFWLKVLKPEVQTAQWVQIHHLQCMWPAPWALQGGQSCVFFGRGNTHYLNSFSVVTTLSDPDFADSPCGGSRRSCRSMINTHFLPSQQKNCFEKSVSWTWAFREELEIINI